MTLWHWTNYTDNNDLSNLTENLSFLWVLCEKNIQNTKKNTAYLLNFTDHFFLCTHYACRLTALHCRTETLHQKENERFSWVINWTRLPSLMKNDMASAPTAPIVSTAMGMKVYVDRKFEYLEILRLSASRATVEGLSTIYLTGCECMAANKVPNKASPICPRHKSQAIRAFATVSKQTCEPCFCLLRRFQ